MKKIKQNIIQQDKIKTTKLEQDNTGRRKKTLKMYKKQIQTQRNQTQQLSLNGGLLQNRALLMSDHHQRSFFFLLQQMGQIKRSTARHYTQSKRTFNTQPKWDGCFYQISPLRTQGEFGKRRQRAQKQRAWMTLRKQGLLNNQDQ